MKFVGLLAVLVQLVLLYYDNSNGAMILLDNLRRQEKTSSGPETLVYEKIPDGLKPRYLLSPEHQRVDETGALYNIPSIGEQAAVHYKLRGKRSSDANRRLQYTDGYNHFPAQTDIPNRQTLHSSSYFPFSYPTVPLRQNTGNDEDLPPSTVNKANIINQDDDNYSARQILRNREDNKTPRKGRLQTIDSTRQGLFQGYANTRQGRFVGENTRQGRFQGENTRQGRFQGENTRQGRFQGNNIIPGRIQSSDNNQQLTEVGGRNRHQTGGILNSKNNMDALNRGYIEDTNTNQNSVSESLGYIEDNSQLPTGGVAGSRVGLGYVIDNINRRQPFGSRGSRRPVGSRESRGSWGPAGSQNPGVVGYIHDNINNKPYTGDSLGNRGKPVGVLGYIDGIGNRGTYTGDRGTYTGVGMHLTGRNDQGVAGFIEERPPRQDVDRKQYVLDDRTFNRHQLGEVGYPGDDSAIHPPGVVDFTGSIDQAPPHIFRYDSTSSRFGAVGEEADDSLVRQHIGSAEAAAPVGRTVPDNFEIGPGSVPYGITDDYTMKAVGSPTPDKVGPVGDTEAKTAMIERPRIQDSGATSDLQMSQPGSIQTVETPKSVFDSSIVNNSAVLHRNKRDDSPDYLSADYFQDSSLQASRYSQGYGQGNGQGYGQGNGLLGYQDDSPHGNAAIQGNGLLGYQDDSPHGNAAIQRNGLLGYEDDSPHGNVAFQGNGLLGYQDNSPDGIAAIQGNGLQANQDYSPDGIAAIQGNGVVGSRNDDYNNYNLNLNPGVSNGVDYQDYSNLQRAYETDDRKKRDVDWYGAKSYQGAIFG